ncbi:MAG: hypothetical protein IOD12_13515 [Silvanigrellales bacterium]|jgi:hypothetical protein|nr:hypothetical protein [Silvanigrellales bacterium]
MTVDLLHPRKSARDTLRKSLPSAQWEQNWAFTQDIVKWIDAHRIMSHPLIQRMNEGDFDLKALKVFHLEFGFAFAQIFTDAVLRAMGTCTQLERRLGPLGKVAPRFLLQLNMLDELGFDGHKTCEDGISGHPVESHYVKFHDTLAQLGLTHEDMLFYRPSPLALACRQTFEATYADHTALTCALACSESCFDVFAGPWAKNVEKRTEVKVEGGYHSIHGLTEEGTGIDDDHSEDMWYVFAQTVTPERYREMRLAAEIQVDTWAEFADYLESF